ncbi:hypothetical protein K438DRAFT_1962618 [Mycena galopus ATCC 62051]|nr:hypothetical protein K438DRAFT_1962618 [Mycena galopus ATCC 62051]
MATASSGGSFSSIAGGITDLSAAPSSTLADQQPSEAATAAPVPVQVPAPGEEAPAPPVKRPVGRPKGSKNKIHTPFDSGPVEKRPVGRPRGTGKKPDSASSVVKRPVGRPRKDGLPPGSTSSKTTFSTLVPPTSDHRTQINQWVPFTGSISAPVAPVPASVIDPALQRNEWAELAHIKPEEFLHVLLAALDAPNSPALTGPSVEEAFKSHLGSLAPPPSASAPTSSNGAPAQSTQPPQIPSLYSILKTFWLPSSPSYFALTASATSARTPSPHRFLYWDPQPLVFNGIPCPACAAPLANKGRIRTGPITVHDLSGPFFVIGCAYACTGTTTHTYASTDAAVRRALPAALEREFPARLLKGDTGVGADVWNWRARGVSRALWHLVLGALRVGLARDVILQLVRGVQQGVPEGEGVGDAGEDVDVDAPGDADADAAPMEEEESASEAAGAASGTRAPDVSMPPHHAAAPLSVPAPEPMLSPLSSATQAFNDAWTANSVITNSMGVDVRNNPMAYARFALPMFPPQPNTVPGTGTGIGMPYDPAQQQLKRAYPFDDGSLLSPGASTSTQVTADGAGGPTKKPRSPRHCCKCGSHLCKGKGGRSFCTNPCMDCGRFECAGRSSRRPDKRCESVTEAGGVVGQPVQPVQPGEVAQLTEQEGMGAMGQVNGDGNGQAAMGPQEDAM